ncbi:MAG: hypothetical protein P8M30_00575 [Planctomycetaceae bacterium]|nr:hypothetical protein [Planctomycetaceae bacterium]
MRTLIGIDEAGFGPNLGPLVITASVWEIDADYRPDDLWKSLSPVISQTGRITADQIHVADSKQVHQSSKGIGPLERSVRVLLEASGHSLTDWSSFSRHLDPLWGKETGEPWFDDAKLKLPIESSDLNSQQLSDAVLNCWNQAGIKLRTIRSRIVPAREFNRYIDEWDSKSLLLSRLSLQLLDGLWDRSEPTLIVCDKHGARNRYDELIDEICDGDFIFRLEEGKAISRYKVGESELRFRMKAESHFPVAVSSMIAKYLRETSMELFNQYWTTRFPELKPTKGYPQDAKRFRKEIESECQLLGLPEADWWRCR